MKKHRVKFSKLKDQRKALGLTPYFTVRIPHVEAGATQWHPTTSTGPFSVLSRGAFKTAKQARAWADKHLNKRPYGVVQVKP